MERNGTKEYEGVGVVMSVRKARRLERRIATAETERMKTMREGVRVKIWDTPPDESTIKGLARAANEAVVATVALVRVRFSLRAHIDTATRRGMAENEGTGGIARERRLLEVLAAAMNEQAGALDNADAVARRIEAERNARKDSGGYHGLRASESTVQIEWRAQRERAWLESEKQHCEERADDIQATLNEVGARERVTLSDAEVVIIKAAGIAI